MSGQRRRKGCLARAEPPPHASRDQPGLKELARCRVRGVAIHSKRESPTGRGGKEHHSPVRLRNALRYAGGDKVVGVALKSRAVYYTVHSYLRLGAYDITRGL